MCETGDAADPQVANPYRAAIVAAKQRSADPAEVLGTALDQAVTAMEAGAWIGGTADGFASSLTGWRSTARRAGSAALEEFDDAVAGQPERVEVNSWQVHWRNLGPR